MPDPITKLFVCHRCGRVNPDYLSFGARTWSGKEVSYCLYHIPRWVKVWMRLRGVV